MRIIFLVEGGYVAGLGHLTRTLSIAQAFLERPLIPKPVFFVRGPEEILQVLEGFDSATVDWTLPESLENLALDKNVLLFVDSYTPSRNILEELSSRVGLAVFLDDTNRLHYPEGLVVNVNISAGKFDYGAREIPPLLGLNYMPLRKPFWQTGEVEIRRSLKRVLVISGGSDDRNLIPPLLSFLQEHFPEFSITAVAGAAARNLNRVRELVRACDRLIVSADASRMLEMMLDSDLAISAAGQTLAELARVGLPAISVTVADNQEANARCWAEAGFTCHAGNRDDPELLNKTGDFISLLLSQEERSRRASVGKKLVDGKGALRLASSVLSIFFKKRLDFRIAGPEDRESIFKLACEPLIRLHAPEFLKSAESNRTSVVCSLPGEPVLAIACFEHDKAKESTFSFALGPVLRGLGLSSWFIDKAISVFLSCKPGSYLFKTYVKKENMAAIAALTRASFKPAGQIYTQQSDCKSNFFIYERKI